MNTGGYSVEFPAAFALFSCKKIHCLTEKIEKIKEPDINVQTFRDQFNSSIHSNEDIRDVNKFNYLHSFICDKAREMISGLAPTSSNYKTAVDILQKRYGNKQVLISSFMNKFVTLAKVKNDKDIKGLRKLLDQTESSIRNLSSLDVTTDRYGTLLFPLINDKLLDNINISIAKKFDDEIWDTGKLFYCVKKLRLRSARLQ